MMRFCGYAGCTSNFHQERSLDKHRELEHGNKGEASFACRECKQLFLSKQRRVVHIKLIHPGLRAVERERDLELLQAEEKARNEEEIDHEPMIQESDDDRKKDRKRRKRHRQKQNKRRRRNAGLKVPRYAYTVRALQKDQLQRK